MRRRRRRHLGGAGPVGPAREFVERHGVDGFAHVHDEDGSLWQRFGSVGRSSFVFVDEDGAVEVTGYGEYGDADKLHAKIDELLAG